MYLHQSQSQTAAPNFQLTSSDISDLQDFRDHNSYQEYLPDQRIDWKKQFYSKLKELE